MKKRFGFVALLICVLTFTLVFAACGEQEFVLEVKNEFSQPITFVHGVWEAFDNLNITTGNSQSFTIVTGGGSGPSKFTVGYFTIGNPSRSVEKDVVLGKKLTITLGADGGLR